MKYLVFAALAALCVGCNSTEVEQPELKPRLVVLTDIGPAEVEPDDNESAVRLMAYADRFEIEAICTTTGWNCDPYPAEWAEYLDRVINAYEHDVPNLMKRSGQTEFMSLDEECGSQPLGYWPSADYLRSRAMPGSQRAGIGVIGEGNDSPGSDMIIALADEDDPRPIYVCAWGGANTLAQAIWRVQQTRTPEQLRDFLHKLRVYTITDQDMQWSMRMQRDYSAHQWLRREFADDLMFVWDESAWLNQNELGKNDWDRYAEYIQGHGALGEVYPHYLWGVEGDTPSFLNAMPNGLNDPDDPTQVGWGGYHVFAMTPDSITMAWTNWHEPVKSISDAYEKRFYPDEFNDFAARMDWAQNGEGNTNPVVRINIQGEGLTDLALSGGASSPRLANSVKPICVSVRPGTTVMLDASTSYDPEGDNLSFHWWMQPLASGRLAVCDTLSTAPQLRVPLPIKFETPLHFICEVRDDGPFNLVSYRRVILIPAL